MKQKNIFIEDGPAIYKQFSTVISRTSKGERIREKFGHKVLISKEQFSEHGFYILNVHRVFCKKCNALQKLSEPKKFFLMMGSCAIVTQMCTICHHLNNYKFK